MGGGRWTSDDWGTYTSTTTKGKTTKEVFSKNSMHADFDPKGIKVRESVDSDDNPNSTAMIVALDVTGSMHNVIDAIARDGLNTLCQEVYDRKPITDPHIMCMGVGDVVYDRAPLQCTQFEADIRIAEQIKDIWLEGGGGGNSCESYQLPWYFAALHTEIDCMKKRGKKGYLFTIGDEEPPKNLTSDQVNSVFGTTMQGDLSIEDVLQMAQRNYHVFHIIIEEGSHMRYYPEETKKAWNALLGQRAILLSDHTKLAETIVSIMQVIEGEEVAKVVDSWDGSTGLVVKKAVDALAASKDAETDFVEL